MKKTLRVSIGQYSSAGRKPVNQDFYGAFIPAEPLLSAKGIVVGIADGISSSQVSQIASETAIKGFIQDYYCTSEAWSVKTSAQRVLKATNSWLYAQTRNSPYRFNKDKGYICTLSALIFKSNTAHLFHSGDSRIFRVTGNTLEQLTTDHRQVVDEQTSYLTRALGIHDTLEMDYRTLPLHEGDLFVLATDGAYEFVSPRQIAVLLQDAEDLDAVARQIAEEAYVAGSDDNISIQIVRIDSLPEQRVEEIQQQLHHLPPAPALAARMHFDGFHILRDLYISSRSHVFLAEDEESGRKVIIKTPSMEMRNDTQYLESFLMEDWIARRLDNAHILKAIDFKRKRNYLYTVTELVEGQTLAQWMVDNPSPDLETVRNIIVQIGKGLQAFHRQEMVHQDVRPNNIMVDMSGTVKIIDFGSTKVAGISEVIAKNEGIMGTAQFTAPEYFLGELGTPQSDVFALGVIAYQMLSGQLPYGNAVSQATHRRAQGKLVYQSLNRTENNVPGWVDYAIAKAVRIDPLKRYSEVSEFLFELTHPSRDFLAKSRPPLIERNPVLFWQSVSLILLGIILFQATQ